MNDQPVFGRRSSGPGGPGGGGAAAPALVEHRFEFRGSGSEFFGIWIVNIALTLVTLGIFSPWAKVRSRRYFYGNTYVAGQSFDYHAPPWRILVGRLIALALFGGYNISIGISPLLAVPWTILFFFALPWLIVASQRFNARYTSYRNVRFNFTGTYWGAVKAFILWPLLGSLTLGILMPLAHKKRDYYNVNFHSYGGKHFETSFETWSMYKIYLQGLAILFGVIVLAVILLVASPAAQLASTAGAGTDASKQSIAMIGIIAGATIGSGWFITLAFIAASALKLALGHTTLDGRHKLSVEFSVGALIWIALSNIVLILITIGIYYPWAQVRYSRYLAEHMSLLAASDLNEFTSEAFAQQSAIGEELAGFFALDFSL